MNIKELAIGDKINSCVNAGSFASQDWEEILTLIKEAGYVKFEPKLDTPKTLDELMGIDRSKDIFPYEFEG